MHNGLDVFTQEWEMCPVSKLHRRFVAGFASLTSSVRTTLRKLQLLMQMFTSRGSELILVCPCICLQSSVPG